MAESKIFLFVLVLSLGVLVRARHMHPHQIARNYEESNFENSETEEEHAADIDGVPIVSIGSLYKIFVHFFFGSSLAGFNQSREEMKEDDPYK